MYRYTLALFITLFASVGIAHESATGEVGARMNAMSDMGRALKTIQTELRKGKKADLDLVDLSADKLAGHAELLPLLFENEAYGQGSDAKPEIWTDWQEFIVQASAMQTQIGLLQSAIADGNRNDAKDAVRKVQRTCGQCHQTFRTD